MDDSDQKIKQAALLQQLEFLASWLDDRFVIPGTRIRIGLDSLLGLIPVAGDLVTALISCYIVGIAIYLKAPVPLWLAMFGRIALDLFGGSIPVVGDVLDMFYRANRKNVNLLLRHLARTGQNQSLRKKGEIRI